MPTPSDAERSLARARLARLVAAAFCRPWRDLAERVAAPGVRDELTQAARTLGLAAGGVDALVDALRTAAPDDGPERHLGHTVRSRCPPYELEYRSAEIFQQSQTLADIAGFYAAFGFEPAGRLSERGDHVVVEWEFLSILALKESLAKSADERACCIAAQADFLREHAATWMPAFFERIRRRNSGGVVRRLAELGRGLLTEWCAARDVAIGPRWLELRPVDDGDSNITCGAGGGVELGPALAAAMEARGGA